VKLPATAFAAARSRASRTWSPRSTAISSTTTPRPAASSGPRMQTPSWAKSNGCQKVLTHETSEHRSWCGDTCQTIEISVAIDREYSPESRPRRGSHPSSAQKTHTLPQSGEAREHFFCLLNGNEINVAVQNQQGRHTRSMNVIGLFLMERSGSFHGASPQARTCHRRRRCNEPRRRTCRTH